MAFRVSVVVLHSRNSATLYAIDLMRLQQRTFRLLPVASVILLATCQTARPITYQVEPVTNVVGCSSMGCADENDAVAITYLGNSGFEIRYRNSVLLTAPFFSNPPVAKVIPKYLLPPFLHRKGDNLKPDTSLIERLLPHSADAASMLLVGHAHYDHLMDVPYMLRKRVKQAVVYGSPTTRHTLMGDTELRSSKQRIIAISNDSAGTLSRVGKWYYNSDSTFRVMALVADHAPSVKFGPLKGTFASGAITKDLNELPKRAQDWRLGEPFSYLIDVLIPGSNNVRLRIYFQDAPNTPPLGFPPESELKRRQVDVALLCAATSSNVPDAPGRLLSLLQPRYVIVGHWEDLFRPQVLPLKPNIALDADEFFDTLAKSLPISSRWVMPLPRTTISIDLRQ